MRRLRRWWLSWQLRRLEARIHYLAAKIREMRRRGQAAAMQDPARVLSEIQIEWLLLRQRLGLSVVQVRAMAVRREPLPLAKVMKRG